MKESVRNVLAFQKVSVLSSQKNKAAKVQNMTRHLSQASESMSRFFSHKGAQRKNSDLTVTEKRSVPTFLNASEVCSSLKQDSNDAGKTFRYKKIILFFCITLYSMTTLFKSKVACLFFDSWASCKCIRTEVQTPPRDAKPKTLKFGDSVSSRS